jgi:pSer/pThr/pTyr-binding forkhead associated (FHA) protein
MKFWCGEQLIVTVEGPAGRSVVSLEQPFARVGRHPQSDVVLDDPGAAARSLYLHATPRGVFCLFLDVHASDVPAADVAARGIWLRPDQEITVGSHRVRASLLTAEPDDPLPEDNPATWGSAPRPLPVIGVYYGDLLKDKRRFRAVLSPVGRRPQCGLQLKAKRVSSFHCVLFWHEQRLWCVDLNSSNGTQLNGEPIVCSQVTIGDKLDVGEFSLVFERLSYGRTAQPSEAQSSIADGGNENDPIAESQPADTYPTTPTTSPPATPPVDDSETLRRQLADEIARVAAEREMIQERWEQASRQLQTEVARLHEEAARLAAERAAFDQERSQQLAHLQDELSQATASLQQKLAAVEQSSRPIPEEAAPATPDEATLAALAPATLIAGLDDELASPPESAVVWNYVATDPGEDLPPPIDPLEEARSRLEAQWHAQWEERNRQLTEQIERLRAEAAELAAERQALGQSRQAWQAEQQALAESLAARQEQIDRQQAEVSTAAATLAARLAASEAALANPHPSPMPEPPPATTPAQLLPDPQVEHEQELESEPELAPSPELEPVLESELAPALEPGPGPSDAELESIASEVFELPEPPRPESPKGEPQRTDSERDTPAAEELDLDTWEESAAEDGPAEADQLPALADLNPKQSLASSAAERAQQDELALFVTNRLVHRESQKHRPQLVWWIVAGVGVIAIAAAIAVAVWWML